MEKIVYGNDNNYYIYPGQTCSKCSIGNRCINCMNFEKCRKCGEHHKRHLEGYNAVPAIFDKQGMYISRARPGKKFEWIVEKECPKK
jgi:hypothetical protein